MQYYIDAKLAVSYKKLFKLLKVSKFAWMQSVYDIGRELVCIDAKQQIILM
jgi:hypothetical protein